MVEVAVAVGGGPDRRVAEVVLDLFEVCAGGDEEGGAGVAEVVEPEPGGEVGVLDGGAVVAGHERAVP